MVQPAARPCSQGAPGVTPGLGSQPSYREATLARPSPTGHATQGRQAPRKRTNTLDNLGQVCLGCLGEAAISADGSTLCVTAARGEPAGHAVTRLVEISVADGRVLRIAYERPFRDPGNIIYGWGPMAIDPTGASTGSSLTPVTSPGST